MKRLISVLITITIVGVASALVVEKLEFLYPSDSKYVINVTVKGDCNIKASPYYGNSYWEYASGSDLRRAFDVFWVLYIPHQKANISFTVERVGSGLCDVAVVAFDEEPTISTLSLIAQGFTIQGSKTLMCETPPLNKKKTYTVSIPDGYPYVVISIIAWDTSGVDIKLWKDGEISYEGSIEGVIKSIDITTAATAGSLALLAFAIYRYLMVK